MKIILKLFTIFLTLINIPFAIAAAIIVGYRQLKVSQKLGVSSTMIEVISGRYAMHLFGLKKDPSVVKLMKVLPNASPEALRIITAPFYVYHKLTGDYMIYPKPKVLGKETLLDMITARTVYFDAIINKYKGVCDQFLVLGSGMDTRCYNDFRDVGIRLFEGDQEHNLKFKKLMLERANINASAVTFASLNFKKNTWLDELQKSGFDVSKRTIVLWEGVSLYLSEQDVDNTLRILKTNLAKESIVTFDVYDTKFVAMGQKQGGYIAKRLEMTGENLDFSCDLRGLGKSAIENIAKKHQYSIDHCFMLGSKSKSGCFLSVNSFIV